MKLGSKDSQTFPLSETVLLSEESMRCRFRGPSVLYSHCMFRSVQRPQRGRISLHFFFYSVLISTVFCVTTRINPSEVASMFIVTKDAIQEAFHIL
jgi:hypothetical protein